MDALVAIENGLRSFVTHISEKRKKGKVNDEFKRVGLYIGPISGIAIWLAVSLGFGAVGAYLLSLMSGMLGWNLNIWFVTAFGIAVAAIVGYPDYEEVPKVHGAMVTFLGRRLRIYRTEGNYIWTGKTLGFGRSRLTSENGTDDEGFVFLGQIQLAIWNESSDYDEKGRGNITLNNIAKDTTDVMANLLIVLEILDPMRWLNSSDATLDIADRARAALRTAIAFFTGTDNAAIKGVLGFLMSGGTIVSSFIRRSYEESVAGSMIKDNGGAPIYLPVKPEPSEDFENAELRTKDEFRTKRLLDADQQMLQFVYGMDAKEDANKIPRVESRTVIDSLAPVIEALGLYLHRATVADITLSKPVADEANKAAGEVFQHNSRVRSARAIKAARSELIADATEAAKPGYELATLIAGEQDSRHPGSYKLIHIGGDAGNTPNAIVGGLSAQGGNTP